MGTVKVQQGRRQKEYGEGSEAELLGPSPTSHHIRDERAEQPKRKPTKRDTFIGESEMPDENKSHMPHEIGM